MKIIFECLKFRQNLACDYGIYAYMACMLKSETTFLQTFRTNPFFRHMNAQNE